MTTIEFDATIESDTLPLPKEALSLRGQKVHCVIQSKEEQRAEAKRKFLQKCMSNPHPIQDFKPLTREEIYDR